MKRRIGRPCDISSGKGRRGGSPSKGTDRVLRCDSCGGGSLDDLPKTHLPSLKDVLNEHIGRSHMTILAIAELAGVSNSTMHRIMKGEIHPSRNVLLRLALVLGMSFDATQLLLEAGNRSSLSGGRCRDRPIMQAIIQKKTISYANEKLNEGGFQDLFSRRD